jgi:hypothetical protein
MVTVSVGLFAARCFQTDHFLKLQHRTDDHSAFSKLEVPGQMLNCTGIALDLQVSYFRGASGLRFNVQYISEAFRSLENRGQRFSIVLRSSSRDGQRLVYDYHLCNLVRPRGNINPVAGSCHIDGRLNTVTGRYGVNPGCILADSAIAATHTSLRCRWSDDRPCSGFIGF